MKILFISALYPPHTKGGGEISTHIIAQALIQKGHQVDVVTGNPNSTHALDKYMYEGVAILRLPLKLDRKPLLEQRYAKKMALSIERYVPNLKDYDIVHAQDFRGVLILFELVRLASVLQAKTAVTARDYAQLCGSPNNMLFNGQTCDDGASLRCIFLNEAVVRAPLMRKPFRIWQYWYNISYRRMVFRSLARHIFISESQKQEIVRIQNVDNQQTAVIYNPIAPNFISAPLVKPRGGKHILYIGRMQDYKGVGLLLNAFRALHDQYPDAHLTLIGQGDQFQQYQKQIIAWGFQKYVSLHPAIPYKDVLSAYDETDILVAPHLWVEPFGRTVIEAMARGRVVVSANHGGPSDFLWHDVTGILFQHGSLEGLKKALDNALSMPVEARQQMGKRARQWTIDNLDPHHIAQQYLGVYGLK